MSKVIEAIYDGYALIPQEPVDLHRGDRVKVTLRVTTSADRRTARQRRLELVQKMWKHFEETPPPGGPLPDDILRRESIYEDRS
jgi:predicted DNA-binding antitoxin AbrB/MazE fold protein